VALSVTFSFKAQGEGDGVGVREVGQAGGVVDSERKRVLLGAFLFGRKVARRQRAKRWPLQRRIFFCWPAKVCFSFPAAQSTHSIAT
jgi:hypothetical protein